MGSWPKDSRILYKNLDFFFNFAAHVHLQLSTHLVGPFYEGKFVEPYLPEKHIGCRFQVAAKMS